MDSYNKLVDYTPDVASTPNCKDCADTHCGCYGMDCAAVCGGKRFTAKDKKDV